MHIGDSIFIFLLALVLFGPKKLPEIGRQIGKLLMEFRRASNDFKMQIDEELRTMEMQERQEKQEQERLKQEAALGTGATPTILPPAALPPTTGEQVPAANPYAVSAPEPEPEPNPETAMAVSATTGQLHSSENHPLLAVDEIPPWEPPAVPVASTNGHSDHNG